MISVYIYIPIKYNEIIHGKKPEIFSDYKYSVGPYVQFGPAKHGEVVSTSASMIIWWFNPRPLKHTAYIKYGKDPNIDKMETGIETLNGDGKRHEVQLEALDPLSKYYYHVPDLDDTIYSFTTGSTLDPKVPFHILSTGDVRNHGKDKKSFYSEINQLADRVYRDNKIVPVFKIILGDLTRHGRDHESWNVYFTGEKKHSSFYPTMPVIGNHEMFEDYGGNYDYFFNQPRYYSFIYSNAIFIHINNYDGLFRTTGRDQYNFLTDKLKENFGRRWIIISLHEPILSTGDYNMNELLINQFFELFRKYNVDLVLAGHDHHYDAFHVDRDKNWGGTVYVINGGGGAKVDDFMMRRNELRWKRWYHDRNSPEGLYQNDLYTEKYHLYGEISWGFLDLEIGKDSLTTRYYRWMHIDEYLEKTGQEPGSWDITPVGLTPAKMVHSVTKIRDFKASRQR